MSFFYRLPLLDAFSLKKSVREDWCSFFRSSWMLSLTILAIPSGETFFSFVRGFAGRELFLPGSTSIVRWLGAFELSGRLTVSARVLFFVSLGVCECAEVSGKCLIGTASGSSLK